MAAWKSRIKQTKKPKAPEIPETVEQTFKRLESWCAGNHGRKAQLARALALHPSQVSRWIARGGVPRLQKFCELIEFLDRQVPTERKTQ